VTGTTSTGTPTSSAITPNQSGTAAAFIFSPYKDTSIDMDWNTGVISTEVTGGGSPVPMLSVLPSGLNTVSWAFATGDCTAESWGGAPSATVANANVALFVSGKVNYILSTGGAGGVFTCASASNLVAFINRYASPYLVGIDFDIEDGQTQGEVDNLVQAVKGAQATFPNMRFSFTVGTLAANAGGTIAASLGSAATDNFGAYGDMVMSAIGQYGLTRFTINLMVMDYGPPSAGVCVVNAAGACDMGQSAIQAAYNLHDKWGVPYAQIELTAMIGGNDQAGETFTLQDADTVAAFALKQGLAGVHFWSFDRDTDCAPAAASATCNTYGQAGTLGFAREFVKGGL